MIDWNYYQVLLMIYFKKLLKQTNRMIPTWLIILRCLILLGGPKIEDTRIVDIHGRLVIHLCRRHRRNNYRAHISTVGWRTGAREIVDAVDAGAAVLASGLLGLALVVPELAEGPVVVGHAVAHRLVVLVQADGVVLAGILRTRHHVLVAVLTGET